MKKRDTYTRLLSIVSFFLIWQVGCMINKRYTFFNPVFLPAPTDIIKTAYSYIKDGQLYRNVIISLARLCKGYTLGVCAGIFAGFFIGKYRSLHCMLEPIFSILSSIPTYALCPLMIIWFGIGENSKIILISVTTFFPMAASTAAGIQSVDYKMVQCAKSLGANSFQIFRMIYFMSAEPHILFGMRSCLNNAFAALIVAEMMGATEGLGFIIVNSRNWFLVSDMFLSILIIIILYLILKESITILERKKCRWLHIKEEADK